jgi:hypothetical protein
MAALIRVGAFPTNRESRNAFATIATIATIATMCLIIWTNKIPSRWRTIRRTSLTGVCNIRAGIASTNVTALHFAAM